MSIHGMLKRFPKLTEAIHPATLPQTPPVEFDGDPALVAGPQSISYADAESKRVIAWLTEDELKE